ncbi:MAG: hypothetical protein LBI13_06650 [Streptococcaceae bacterium]|jgi:uncharacterized membrane protein|nr:hypothetical protein [Streptococcaceae bacterium]
MKNLEIKIDLKRLSFLDLLGIVGAILVLVGVFALDFIHFGEGAFTIRGSLASLPDKLRALESLVSTLGASSNNNLHTAIIQLTVTIWLFSLTSVALIVFSFFKNKGTKIGVLGLVFLSFVTDLFLNERVGSLLTSMKLSGTNALGGKVIFVGLIVMLVAQILLVIQAFKRPKNENENSEKQTAEKKVDKTVDKKVLALLAVIFGGIALLFSFFQEMNLLAILFALAGLVLGIIALVQAKTSNKILSIIGTSLSGVSVLVVIVVMFASSLSKTTAAPQASSPSSSSIMKVPDSSSEEKQSTLGILNELAAESKTTDEIYITGDITVGAGQSVTPGIYDLTITGGEGNITGERKSINGLFINWIGGVSGNTSGDASTIRVLLFNGDILKFSNISKVKFTAIPAKVTSSTQIGIGNYVVGRDIPAGTYKLSTNMQLSAQFQNLGWNIDIYNDTTRSSQSQAYNSGNSDVAVSLKEGEVLTTTFDNSNYYETGISSDTAKLIFTPVK